MQFPRCTSKDMSSTVSFSGPSTTFLIQVKPAVRWSKLVGQRTTKLREAQRRWMKVIAMMLWMTFSGIGIGQNFTRCVSSNPSSSNAYWFMCVKPKHCIDSTQTALRCWKTMRQNLQIFPSAFLQKSSQSGKPWMSLPRSLEIALSASMRQILEKMVCFFLWQMS